MACDTSVPRVGLESITVLSIIVLGFAEFWSFFGRWYRRRRPLVSKADRVTYRAIVFKSWAGRETTPANSSACPGDLESKLFSILL